jgi:hypothetical protein
VTVATAERAHPEDDWSPVELRAAHARLAELQSITAALAQSLTVEDVGRVVT